MARLLIRDLDIVVISLANRSDRRKVITESLKREGLNYKIFDAIPAPKVRPDNWKLSLPLWGCRESHIRVLEAATRPTLVLEDDAHIPLGFADKLAELIEELPDEWAVLRLGGAHVRPPQPFSKKLLISHGALYPHAYLVREPSSIVHGARSMNIDWGSYFKIQDRRNHQTYAANPWLIDTTGSPSDIPDSVPINERQARRLAIFTPRLS